MSKDKCEECACKDKCPLGVDILGLGTPTMKLRFYNGILQQQWIVHGGTMWKPVPSIGGDHG